MGVGILIGLLAGLPLYGVLLLLVQRGNRRAVRAAQAAAEEAAYYAAAVAPAYPAGQAPLPQPPAGAYLPADYGWESVPEPWIEGEAYEVADPYPAPAWDSYAEAESWDDVPTQPYPVWQPAQAAPRRAARILGN